MKELLEELKKIDPACYEEIWQWALWIEEEGEVDDIERFENHRDDVIQGCVQRACEARGWAWMNKIHMGSGIHDAEIYWKTRENWKDHGGMAKFGHSPAEAILTAYLAARKAQLGRPNHDQK